MNKNRKKYQNVLEKRNHLAVTSGDHNTIEELESQALDAFQVEASSPEMHMQRMGQLNILPLAQRRYNLKSYNFQSRMQIPGLPRKIITKTQTLDSFAIKSKQKPSLMQRPVFFNIFQKKPKKILKEEQLDSFICPKKEKPLILQNVHGITIEKEKKLANLIESLGQVNLPATGKFFNNHPVLKSSNILELEYLKIKAPLQLENSSNLFLPFKPKKMKFDDMKSENCSNLLYSLNKVKVFNPSSTSIDNNVNNFLIPYQPKKTHFTDLTSNKALDVLFLTPPKKKVYDDVAVESNFDIFIPEQPKRRYYSLMNTDNMSIHGSERPEFCLEIDPNEEIFIPNVYDMLLVQNYWDDLTTRSFRICIRPPGYVGKSSKKMIQVADPNVENLNENENENNEENEQDKDVLKDFNNNHKNENQNREKIDNIYEDVRETNENKNNLNDENRHKESKIKYHLFNFNKKV